MDSYKPSVREVFDSLDTSGKGYIEIDEFAEKLVEYFGHGELTLPDDTIELLRGMLNESEGRIYYDNFKDCFAAIMDRHGSEEENRDSTATHDSGIHENEEHHFSQGDMDSPSGEDCFENYLDEDFSSNHKSMGRHSIASAGLDFGDSTGQPAPGGVRHSLPAVFSARQQAHQLKMKADVSMMEEEEEDVRCHGDLNEGRLQELESLRGSEEELRHQVEQLRRVLEEVESRYTRQREEGHSLVERIHSMEEHVRETELSCKDTIDNNERKLNSTLSRLERQHEEEVEEYKERIRKLESKNDTTIEEVNQLQEEYDQILMEKRGLEELVHSADLRYRSLESTLDHYRSATSKQMDDLHKERDRAVSIMEGLHGEMEELQQERSSTVQMRRRSGSSPLSRRRSRALSVISVGSVSGFGGSGEMEQLVRTLTAENKALKEHLAESQAELMSHRLDSHVAESPGSRDRGFSFGGPVAEAAVAMGLVVPGGQGKPRPSLADEMESLTVEELKRSLATEKDAVTRLQSYIDYLLMRIMESDAAILDVTAKSRK